MLQENVLQGGQSRADSSRGTTRISSVSEDVRLNRSLWAVAEETQMLEDVILPGDPRGSSFG
jgi:hypothetical protein